MAKGCIQRLYNRLCDKLVALGYIVQIDYCQFAILYLFSKKCHKCGRQFEHERRRKAIRIHDIGVDKIVRLKHLCFTHLHCIKSERKP